MMSLLSSNLDLTIAGGLIIIAVVLFLLSKMNVLPQKSLPYIAIAIAGVFGITIFRSWSLNKKVKDLKDREAKMKEKEVQLEGLKKNSEQKELDLQIALKKLEDERAAYKQAILENTTITATQREQLSSLSGDELAEKAWAILHKQ